MKVGLAEAADSAGSEACSWRGALLSNSNPNSRRMRVIEVVFGGFLVDSGLLQSHYSIQNDGLKSFFYGFFTGI